MGSASIPPPALSAAPPAGLSRIGVLDANRPVAQRVGRVLRAASGLAEVSVEADPATLRGSLDDDPLLLACDASDIDIALDWSTRRYPSMSVVAWASGDMSALLEAARTNKRLVSLLGWPSFASMPRPWELAMATRRIVDAAAVSPRLGELFPWGSTVARFRPRTSAERDAAVTEVCVLSERAGASPRVSSRVAEVAHEMLMNAMYDAPVDANGTARYAHDRKQEVDLDDHEVPTFRLAADGINVALQVVDPFGGLRREHVLDGILRGRAAANGDRPAIDTSNGGAGLGLYRIYNQSTVMIVDVEPGRFTSVTAFFDLLRQSARGPVPSGLAPPVRPRAPLASTPASTRAPGACTSPRSVIRAERSADLAAVPIEPPGERRAHVLRAFGRPPARGGVGEALDIRLVHGAKERERGRCLPLLLRVQDLEQAASLVAQSRVLVVGNEGAGEGHRTPLGEVGRSGDERVRSVGRGLREHRRVRHRLTLGGAAEVSGDEDSERRTERRIGPHEADERSPSDSVRRIRAQRVAERDDRGFIVLSKKRHGSERRRVGRPLVEAREEARRLGAQERRRLVATQLRGGGCLRQAAEAVSGTERRRSRDDVGPG